MRRSPTQRIVVFCGKGNNGGDGLVVARQLYTREAAMAATWCWPAIRTRCEGDARENYKMLEGGRVSGVAEVTDEMQTATLVMDAVARNGHARRGQGTPAGADSRQSINGFPLADVVSVDVPSGLASDSGECIGRSRACRSHCHVHRAEAVPGALARVRVGGRSCMSRRLEARPSCMKGTTPSAVALGAGGCLRTLFRPRARDSNKGIYGHVLVIAGGAGKNGRSGDGGNRGVAGGSGTFHGRFRGIGHSAIASLCARDHDRAVGGNRSRLHRMRAPDDPARPHHGKKTVIAIGPAWGTIRKPCNSSERFVQNRKRRWWWMPTR